MVFDVTKRFNRRAIFFVTLIMISFCPIFLSAQDSLNVRFIGSYSCGQYCHDPIWYMSKQASITSTQIDGHAYVLVTAGTGIVIFNVDDPANPEIVSQISSPIELCPFVIDSLLYVTAIDRGLKIYNLADPMNPVELGSCACSEWIWSIYVKDSLAYAAGPNQLTVFNVSDPNTPFINGTWTPPLANTSLMYVFVQGQYAYITAEQASGFLYVIDVQDPGNPVLVGSCADLGNVRKLTVKDDYAYVIEWGGLGIIDVSTPANPNYLAYYYGSNDVYLSGGYAYCATWSGLRVLDISVPSVPFLVGSAYEGIEYAITVLDSHAYCIVMDGLSVFDVSEPLLPFKIGKFPMMTEITNIAVEGDIAVASSYGQPAVGTIDIADPFDFTGCGKYVVDYVYNNLTLAIDMQGDFVYVAAMDSGLIILDISDPTSITEIGHYHLPGSLTPRVRNVCVQGDFAYVAAFYDYAFAVISVAVPSNPYVVGNIPYGDSLQIYDICIVGDYAYCTTLEGLKIISISDPYAPHIIAQCGISGFSGRLFVEGSYAYCCDTSNVLWIIDISDPYSPYPVNMLGLVRADGLFAVDNHLFLGSMLFGEGLKILDIADPTNLQLVGFYKTPFIWILDIVVIGNYIYLATADEGLWLLQYFNLGVDSPCEEPIVNMLKLNTVAKDIEIQYTLGKPSSVRIILVDVCGRIVKEIIVHEFNGTHKKRISSAEISAGIYFLRIETDEWCATRKVILLR